MNYVDFKQLHQIRGVVQYESHHAPIHPFQGAFPDQDRIVADVKKAAHVRATHTDKISSLEKCDDPAPWNN